MQYGVGRLTADPDREKSFRLSGAEATDQLGPVEAYNGVTALERRENF